MQAPRHLLPTGLITSRKVSFVSLKNEYWNCILGAGFWLARETSGILIWNALLAIRYINSGIRIPDILHLKEHAEENKKNIINTT